MNYRQFKKLRLDLDEIYAYEIYPSDDPQFKHRINLYPRGYKGSYFQITFLYEDTRDFEETSQFLDEYFSVKTEEEVKILP